MNNNSRILSNINILETLDIYLSAEFFFNLLPCYIFIFIGICRYVSLFRLLRSRYEDESEDGESDIEETPLAMDSEPPPALIIKIKLSYLLAFCYIISVVLAFIMPNDLFWAANYQLQSLCYLIGGFAWLLSGKLIILEYEKEYYQELYTHKLLCPMTAAISLLNILIKTNVKIIFFFNLINFIDDR